VLGGWFLIFCSEAILSVSVKEFWAFLQGSKILNEKITAQATADSQTQSLQDCVQL
jgi:hypothetical protein